MIGSCVLAKLEKVPLPTRKSHRAKRSGEHLSVAALRRVRNAFATPSSLSDFGVAYMRTEGFSVDHFRLPKRHS